APPWWAAGRACHRRQTRTVRRSPDETVISSRSPSLRLSTTTEADRIAAATQRKRYARRPWTRTRRSWRAIPNLLAALHRRGVPDRLDPRAASRRGDREVARPAERDPLRVRELAGLYARLHVRRRAPRGPLGAEARQARRRMWLRTVRAVRRR